MYFEASVSELQFDDVAVNEAACFRSFCLRNVCPRGITVLLESSASCLRFQRENENFDSDERVSCVTLFDEVDLEKAFIIGPGDTLRILAAFIADPRSFSTVGPQGITSNGVITASCDDQVLRIPFLSRVFLSSMTVFPTELVCSIGAGKSQIMEFNVANTSSKLLTFVLRPASLVTKNFLVDVCENELGNSIVGRCLILEAHETKKFFVIVRSGNCDGAQQNIFFVQCDNLRDSRNSLLLQVTTNITNDHRYDLAIVSDTVVDFGDVYRGSCSTRELSITNVSNSDISLKLVRTKRESECSLSFCIDDDFVEDVTIATQRSVKIGLQLKTQPAKLPVQKIRLDVDVVAVNKLHQQLIALRCLATLHTSTIVVAQLNVNFGDCQVGQTKRASFIIENLSPLSGCAILQLRSKIISIDGISRRGEREQLESISLSPASQRSIELRIVPQRVNPTYRKQLTILNKFNQDERFIINIEANNMAPRETKIHDDVYVWDCLLPSETQLRAIAGSPLIIPYIVRSKAAVPLVLFLSTTCSEIETFVLDDERGLRHKFEALCSGLANVYLQEDANCEIVTSTLDEVSVILSQAKKIDTISLHPNQELIVYAKILRSATQLTDFQTKEDGISVKVEGIEMSRFVRLSYRLCSSHFEISGQRTKNFGDVNIGEKKVTKLSVMNKCKSMLFFTITKSRSVTASHVRIGKPDNDRQVYYGSVRPFAIKDVDISFLPGIKGLFEEKLRVTNVLDPSNDICVTVKAQVTKVDTFDVAPESWSFGEVFLGEECCRIGAKLSISNTSRSRRDFRLKLEGPTQDRFFRFEGVDVRIQLEIEHIGASSGSSRKIEEQIEKLEQKLKIYIRKQKIDKIEAARKRIDVLRRALQGEEIDITEEHDLSSSEDEVSRGKSRLSHNELIGLLAREGVALPTLGPSESLSLTLLLNCQRTAKEIPPLQSSSINVMIFEAKDQEINKVVPVDLTLVSNQDSHSLKQLDDPNNTLPYLIVTCQQSYSFLDAPLIPLHNTLLNDWTPFKACVSATLETTFVILEPYRCGGPVNGNIDAKFKFSPRNGTVRAGELQTIHIECFPRCVGPQRYVVPVKNLKNPSDVKHFCVELNPVIDEDLFEIEPRTLDMQTVITPSDLQTSVAKPIIVRNKTNNTLAILVRSNKPTQILLYRDSNGTELLTNPNKVSGKGSLRVYCKFAPTSKAYFTKAKLLTGGVVVESVEAAGEGYTVTCCGVCKVPVTVGTGELLLPGPSVIDLGVIPHTEKGVNTFVIVKNPSQSFTVNFRCLPSPNIIPEHPDGYCLLPGRETHVNLFIKLPTAGLLQETVTFLNATCAQAPVRIQVTALKQDGAVSMSRQDFSFPVAAVERNDGVWKLLASSKSSCTITNHSAKDMILVAKTSAPLIFGEFDATERRTGGRVRVDAKHQHVVDWHLVDVPVFGRDEVHALLSHSTVTISGVAQVEVGQIIDDSRYALFRLSRNIPTVGQCVLIPRFTMRFAVSEGIAEPLEIDVGTIGKPQEVSFHLKNLSSVLPWMVRVECEPTIKIYQSHKVEAQSTTTVRAVIDVDNIRHQGNFKFNVCFVNEMNSENDITATIYGRFYRKLFHVTAEVGREDDLPSITLPQITVDLLSGASSVSETKVVVSSSEASISTTIAVDVAEPLAGLIDLQVLTYDATNIAGALVFAGKPHHVRIRCGMSDTNLSKLMTVFFGARSKQLSSLGYDDLPEVEKWKMTVSPPKWLGRVRFVNSLTTEEEIDVFSSMKVTTTIIAPSKVLLKSVSALRRANEKRRKIYSGRVIVKNPCVSHEVELLASPFVTSRCSSVVALQVVPQRATVLPGREIELLVTVSADVGTEANIEQSMALVFFDESVVFSAQTVRFATTAMESNLDDDVDDTQLEQPQVVGNEAQVLELKNCTPLGVEGSFTYTFAVAKESETLSDLRIANKSTVSLVEYQCQLISQSPHPWLQLTSTTGRLKPQESHELKLALTTAEVGSYIAHATIFNVLNPSEVLIVRINCEVYASASEGLYEIIAPSGMKILSQQAAVVSMGTLFGEPLRTVGFEIYNKSPEALEFLLNIIKPFRFSSKKVGEEVSQDQTSSLRFSLFLPQENLNQNSVVVDPKSRQKIVVAAEKVGVLDLVDSVEIEVVVKCKVARETHHVVKARFDIAPQRLFVEPQYFQASLLPVQTFKVSIRNAGPTTETFVAMFEPTLLQIGSPRMTLESGATGTLDVGMNLTRALGIPHDRGIEEHLFIYRLSDPAEKSMIVFSTVSGRPSRPFSSSGSDHERALHAFVRRFRSVMDAVGSRLVEYVAVDAQQKSDDSEVLKMEFSDDRLPSIVLEGVWLVDEICWFQALLRNSRTFASLAMLLSSVVLNHAVVKSWKQTKRITPSTEALGDLQKLIDSVESLGVSN